MTLFKASLLETQHWQYSLNYQMMFWVMKIGIADVQIVQWLSLSSNTTTRRAFIQYFIPLKTNTQNFLAGESLIESTIQ